MEQQLAQKANQAETKCNSCGAVLHYTPGTTLLTCQYCDAENQIESKSVPIEELDFDSFLKDYLNNKSNTQKVTLVKCDACGSETTFEGKLVASDCAFCGSPIQVKDGTTCDIIKPKSLLPFSIEQKKAFEQFSKWIKSLWFAPNDLKKFVTHPEKLQGIYVPYWTYDADTYSNYTGLRGVYYTTTKTININGKNQTQTVKQIKWYPTAGNLSHFFDDVLVLASTSLTKKYAEALEPWDLDKLIPFDEKYLAGFKAESYHVDLKQGYEDAKKKMETVIRQMIKRQIGGDQQQILTLSTNHNNVTFKHILLPIWLSTFRYRNKVYRFMINGRTGEVQGERPYSAWKITFFVLAILLIIGGIVYLINQNN
jgi:LSD1 subclass zinc finger protein